MKTNFKFLDNSGFTLPEILIALGVAATIAIGGAKLMSSFEKNKAEMRISTDLLSVEKSIEAYLVSVDGCEGLLGKQVGQEFSVVNKAQMFGKGSTLGRVEVDTLKIKSFHPLTGSLKEGFIQVELGIIKDKSRKIVKEIPVAVTMNGGSVEACNIKKTADLMNIKNELCSKTYGLTTTMTCAQVTLYLLNTAIEDACKDAFGGKTPQYKQNGDIKLCNLDAIHGNQACSNGYFSGFDSAGLATCIPKGIIPTTPSASCTDSSWNPDPSGTCSGAPLTQTSNCGNTRSVTGTKTDGACASCTDTTWSATQNAADVCSDAFVSETSNCGKTRNNVVKGTKDCSNSCPSGTSTTGLGGPATPSTCRCLQQYHTWDNTSKDCADRELSWRLPSTCFEKGTLISMADGSQKTIESVSTGEKVRTYDEAKSKYTLSEVVRTYHHEKKSQEMYETTFADGRRLNSTHNHPFYITNLGKYLEAQEIYKKWMEGDNLAMLSSDSLIVPIIHVRRYAAVIPVYNIHVRSPYDKARIESPIGHNYFANGMLVHNKMDCGEPGPVNGKAASCCNNNGGNNGGGCDFYCEGRDSVKAKYDACMSK